jgi:hypothetical protein
MKLIKEYDIDKIGISNYKLILNVIEEFLKQNRLHILEKNDSMIKYRYENLMTADWSFGSRVKQGQINVILNNNKLTIDLSYNNYGLIIFCIFFIGLFLFLLINPLNINFDKDFIVFGVVGLLFIFGGNFIIRYLANKKLISQIDLLIKKLST